MDVARFEFDEKDKKDEKYIKQQNYYMKQEFSG
jgi:hypothetical protein